MAPRGTKKFSENGNRHGRQHCHVWRTGGLRGGLHGLMAGGLIHARLLPPLRLFAAAGAARLGCKRLVCVASAPCTADAHLIWWGSGAWLRWCYVLEEASTILSLSHQRAARVKWFRLAGWWRAKRWLGLARRRTSDQLCSGCGGGRASDQTRNHFGTFHDGV